MPRVFISHAAADKALVDDMKTMLQTGVGLNPTEIFYSSGAGTGIPAGKDFVEHIREQMHEAGFVLAVITPAYLESEFCLAELGAVWYAVDKDFYPLCVPDVDRARLKATLTGTQVEKLDELTSLTDLLQRLCIYAGKEHSAAACTASAQVFLATLRSRLAGLQGSTKVPAEKVEELEEVTRTLGEQLTQARDEISALDDRYEKLKAAKSQEEVDAIEPVGNLRDQIEQLLDTAQTAANALGSTVTNVLPYALKQAGMPWPGNSTYELQDVHEAVDAGYLYDGEDGFVYLNTEWPKIEEALASLREVQVVLQGLEGDDERWFRKTYGVPTDLSQTAAFQTLF